MRKICLPLILLAALLVMTGCSDDDNPTTPGGGTNDAPVFSPAVAIYTPPATMQSANEPGAINARTGIAFANFAPTMALFLVPPATKESLADKAGPWVRTWSISDGDINGTATLTITDTGDAYHWEYVVNGTDGDIIYTNFRLYAAEIAKDESYGWLEFFSAPDDPTSFRWDFMVSGGVTTSDLKFIDGSNSSRWVLVVNDDGSGAIDAYEGTPPAWLLTFHASWNAAGAGTWQEYNPDGSVSDSGGWGVPTAISVLER